MLTSTSCGASTANWLTTRYIRCCFRYYSAGTGSNGRSRRPPLDRGITDRDSLALYVPLAVRHVNLPDFISCMAPRLLDRREGNEERSVGIQCVYWVLARRSVDILRRCAARRIPLADPDRIPGNFAGLFILLLFLVAAGIAAMAPPRAIALARSGRYLELLHVPGPQDRDCSVWRAATADSRSS